MLFSDRPAPGTAAATRALWVHDLLTNARCTLRKRPLKRVDLDGFVAAYGANDARGDRVRTEFFRRFQRAALIGRDKLNLDLF